MSNWDDWHKAAFLIAFAAGIFVVLVLRGAGWFEVHPFVITLLLCCIIIAYAFIAASKADDAPLQNQVADNTYYLGFLFTISTSAVALYSVGLSGQAASEAIQETGSAREQLLLLVPRLVSDLGIALSTTIVGIALRNLLVQPNPDDESLGRIADEIRKKSREVKDLLEEISYGFRNTVEHITLTTRKVEDVCDEAPGIIDDVNEQLRGAFGKFPKVVSETSDNFEQDMQQLLQRLNKILAESLEFPAEELDRKFKKVMDELEQVSVRIKQVDMNVDLSSMELAIGGAADRIIRVRTPMMDLEEQIQSLGNTLDKTNADIKSMNFSNWIMNEYMDPNIKKPLENLGLEIDRLSRTIEDKREQVKNVQIKPWWRPW